MLMTIRVGKIAFALCDVSTQKLLMFLAPTLLCAASLGAFAVLTQFFQVGSVRSCQVGLSLLYSLVIIFPFALCWLDYM